MQEKLKVRATEPMHRYDNDYRLDVSHDAFAANPNQVFEVPNNHFWRSLVLDGLLVLIGEMDARADTKQPGLQPAKRGGRKR
jgi:hypothetical protein